MITFRTLPIYLLLLLVEFASARLDNLLHSARTTAQRHTKRFARDLRIAFGSILVSQNDVITDGTQRKVVYCKPSSGALSSGGSDGGGTSPTNNNTSSTGSRSSPAGTATGTATSNAGKPSSTSSSSTSSFKLVDSHSGNDFFDGWSFWTTGDPTNGIVDYVDESTARSSGILEVNGNGNAIMRVETTDTVANNRKSVRITSLKSYNGGLFILDAVHMPTGCGTWPAWWTNGPNWPAGGEIDIIEGVGDYTNNQMTIHTNPGCQINAPSSNSQLGSLVASTNCAAAETGNQGCGVRSNSAVSYGAAFNSNGGGVYVMSWSADGIAVYFFERDSIPNDITNESPNPANWGKPQAEWPAASCDPFKFFYDNVVIFDTTLCGDWAGGVWGSSGIPGQEQSCAARTGFSTCEAFVRAKGSSFTEAYWEVKSVKIYQEQ